jgi:histone deacetylase 1/2
VHGSTSWILLFFIGEPGISWPRQWTWQWYTDTGATDHVTGELDKMMIRERYNGGEQIHTTNGSGMDITHIGRVICHTLERKLFLNNVLHVPSATKNHVSVHKLASDNNAYLEFHPIVFLSRIKQ